MILDVMIDNGETFYGTLRIMGGVLETPFESANERLARELFAKYPSLKGRHDIVIMD